MTSMARVVVVTIILTGLVCGSACAQMGAVSVFWNDGAGDHTVWLTLAEDPENLGGDSVEPEFCWQGVLDITMTTPDPITFYCSGNFKGAYGQSWDVVRIIQNVTNDTGCEWSGFHIGVVDWDGFLYNVAEVEPGWSPMQNWDESYDFVPGGPEDYIENGGVFDDTIKMYAMGDWDPFTKEGGTGNGTLTFVKYPVCEIPEVPEAGSLAALLTGMAGFAAMFKRRRLVR